METLVLDGKEFVKASKAARDLGYTSDYVGQLCRGGKVTAHLVGRTWYVDVSQLGEHRVTKKRMSRVKAREQAHKSIEEHKKLKIQSEETRVRVNKVRYEEDESELMPVVRKLAITAEKQHQTPRKVIEEESEPYEIVNEGEMIRMSGKLSVIDLSEETQVDEDTVLLQARVNRKSHKKETEANTEEESEQTEPSYEESIMRKQSFNFTDRIAQMGETTEEAPEEVEVVQPEDTTPVPERQKEVKKQSYFGVVFLTLVLLTVATLSLALDARWTLQSGTDKSGVNLESTFGFDIQKTVADIASKIKQSR